MSIKSDIYTVLEYNYNIFDVSIKIIINLYRYIITEYKCALHIWFIKDTFDSNSRLYPKIHQK